MYQPGNKPLSKRLHGEGAEKYIPVAMQQLRKLYAIDAPILTKWITLDGASIFVQKLLAIDIINITVNPGGFFMSAVFRIFDFLPNPDDLFLTPKTLYGVVRSKSKSMEKNWTQIGTPLAPANPITSDLSSDIAINASDSSKLIYGINFTFGVYPYKGAFLEETIQTYPGGNPDGSFDEPYPVLAQVESSVDGVSFETPLEFGENYTYYGGGHRLLPVYKDGNKGIYFISAFDDGLYLGLFTDGDNQHADLTQIHPQSYRSNPTKVANLMPDVLVGFQTWADQYPSPFLFISRDGGTTITQLVSALMTSLIPISYSPTNSSSSVIIPMSSTAFLFVMLRGGYIGGFGPIYDVYRIEVQGNNHTIESMVMTIPPSTGFQARNLGGGVIVIAVPNLIVDDGIGITGYVSVRYLSTDNGASFTQLPMAIPQSDSDGSIATKQLYTILPYAPYVDADQPGSIYVASDMAVNGLTGTPTDATIFKSTDLMVSWQPVTVALKRTGYPNYRVVGEGGVGGLNFGDQEPDAALSMQLTVVGTKQTPLPIDLINPWRCDDSVLPPTSWMQ